MDTTLYYAALREQRETLAKQHPSGFCLVVSVFNLQKQSAPGNLCEVTINDAARLLFEQTHREATEDEARAYLNRQGVEQSRLITDDLEKVRQQFRHIMGDE
jgi:hypothetical protein